MPTTILKTQGASFSGGDPSKRHTRRHDGLQFVPIGKIAKLPVERLNLGHAASQGETQANIHYVLPSMLGKGDSNHFPTFRHGRLLPSQALLDQWQILACFLVARFERQDGKERPFGRRPIAPLA
jgi:hypothetical protein